LIFLALVFKIIKLVEMKKFWKIIFLILGTLVAAIIMAISFIQFGGIPSYDPPKVEFIVKPDSAKVEEGARLATMLCGGCHLNAEGNYSGRLMAEAPKDFGTVYSANITGHPELGIGKWSDSEIAAFLRTGIKPSGQFAPLYMPRFVHMSNQDMEAIIAFFRSSKQEVQPVAFEQKKPEPSFLVKFLCRVAWKPMAYPDKEIPPPDTNNMKVFGEYLVNARYDCYPCHSADFTKVDMLTPTNSFGFLGGGNKLLDMQGNEIFSANITPHPETGIGAWSAEDFKSALRFGKNPKGGVLRYPMMPYSLMSDKEAGAIYEYLRSVPEINNKVNRGS
jgi:mono/diheme cytochrome c family protein